MEVRRTVCCRMLVVTNYPTTPHACVHLRGGELSARVATHFHPQARSYIPEAFKLVDFLGWTLGGFYLARYDNSPVGAFDEVGRWERYGAG